MHAAGNLCAEVMRVLSNVMLLGLLGDFGQCKQIIPVFTCNRCMCVSVFVYISP